MIQCSERTNNTKATSKINIKPGLNNELPRIDNVLQVSR